MTPIVIALALMAGDPAQKSSPVQSSPVQKASPVQKSLGPVQKGVSVQVDAACAGRACGRARLFGHRHLRRAARVVVRTPRVFVRIGRGCRGC